jgi:hypothetical protein
MSRVLIEGFCGVDPSVQAFCDYLLRIEEALWTFANPCYRNRLSSASDNAPLCETLLAHPFRMGFIF